MELSKRLQAVADMVTQGNKVADIGCDHGYVSIYLIKNRISPNVIAMDVKEGPLAKAREHISRYGYSDYIETRLSDGTKELKQGEADTLICAGMGGRLTLSILKKGMDKIDKMQECILQPQSEILLVRKSIREMGFLIVRENMVYEDGKFYPLMKVIPKREKDTVYRKEAEDRFGPFLLAEKNEVLYQFLVKEQKKAEGILRKLLVSPEIQEANQKRIEEIKEEQRQIEMAFSYYD